VNVELQWSALPCSQTFPLPFGGIGQDCQGILPRVPPQSIGLTLSCPIPSWLCITDAQDPQIRVYLILTTIAPVCPQNISLFVLQPFEPSDGCLALRKLMANG
jgi:hypothetical protein